MGESKKLLSVDDALRFSRKEVLETYKNYVHPGRATLQALLNLDTNFVRAEGCKVWDEDGNEYLDFVGGYGSLNLGHNHPAVIEALHKVESAPVMLQTALAKFAAVLAHNLAQITPGDLQNCWFCSSGTEAVEGALKLARMYTGKKDFIYCLGGFHGKTMGSLSVTGKKKYQEPFEPLIPGCIPIPYGDAEALEKALKKHDAAAFIVEPILGEGGIILPPEGYLKEARRLCSSGNTLLIFDEIQTGFGRTGTLFACEHEGIVPDVMILAKSLGGGIVAIGGYITTAAIMKKAYGSSIDKATMLSSTFGGNTHSAAGAIAAVEVVVRENLARQAAEKGAYFLNKLQGLKEKYSIIKDVRGRGLLVGLELAEGGGLLDFLSAGSVKKLSSEFLSSMIGGELQQKYRVLTLFTLNNPNVIRLEPPLTVSYEQLDYAVDAFDKLFSRHKSFLKIALESGKSALSSFFR
ncbi:MAG: aspartate aminotransferase family protein [Dethiobacter sp.]|jgi:putrescine aminotransferase|nr:MAG: aspartate aminotransferase family protein [Dethiobacter sp.]